MKNAVQGLALSPEVNDALQSKLPVVALESTVLTHGLPWPENLEILSSLEAILRESGVVPATIIVIGGVAHIGLDKPVLAGLEQLLRIPGGFFKLGLRDLPLAVTRKLNGGTTVSATMKLAALAGIEIFATGGIGGVHRDWRDRLDISSDLTALASIPVAVVSAGCKAILDIPATLEYLETLAVPVLGWQTDRFPRFYTRDSGYHIDRINNAGEFASFWQAHRSLNQCGVLLANPIPAEHSVPSSEIESSIEIALNAARDKGITGKETTPFLLDFLSHHTKGGSVQANLALLKCNVRVAALLAKALAGNKG